MTLASFPQLKKLPEQGFASNLMAVMIKEKIDAMHCRGGLA
jgi:hypothetical protein